MPRERPGIHVEIILDCRDLDVVARFWQAALGYRAHPAIDGRYLPLSGDGPGMTLQRVSEPKVGKNRMHLDLLVADVEAEASRLRALGATTIRAYTEVGHTWLVLADPEGNEFCLIGDPDQ